MTLLHVYKYLTIICIIRLRLFLPRLTIQQVFDKLQQLEHTQQLMTSNTSKHDVDISQMRAELQNTKTELEQTKIELNNLRNKTSSDLDQTRQELQHKLNTTTSVIQHCESQLQRNISQIQMEFQPIRRRFDDIESDFHQNTNQTRSEIHKMAATVTNNMTNIHTEIHLLQSTVLDGHRVLNTTVSDLDNVRDLLEQTMTQLNTTKENQCHIVNHTIFPLSSEITSFYLLSEALPVDVNKFQTLCNQAGGYLAEMNTAAEFQYVSEFIRQAQVGITRIYIGVTDRGEEGVWRYMTSGQTLTFAKWGVGEPDDGDQVNCGVLHTGDDLVMYDFYCHTDDKYRFLCEVPI